MWDRLRTLGYKGSFLMIHNSGGSGEVFKTTASRTYNGGPVSGLMGSYHLATSLGYKNVVAGDMGGTSFDIGLVVDQSVRNYEFRPIIDRWMVGITMLQTLSIGAGGGSIAWINHDLGGQLNVGPRSAGSDPGPACYDQGGTEPTVTDADVVLGYINPETYYGGRMPLNRDKAERAVREKIAEPMGIGVEQAAALIRHIVDQNMSQRHQARDPPARLPPGGLRAVRVRRGRADPRVRLPRRPGRGRDLPDRAGVLRTGLVDHGHRPRLRDLPPDDRDGADDPGADHRVRGVQRRRRPAGRAGQSRSGGRGPARGPGRVQPRAGHALRRAGQREAHRLPGAAPAPPGGRPGAVRRVRAGVLRGLQPAGRQQARRRLPGQLRAEGHRADREAGLAGPPRAARGRRGGPDRQAAGLVAGPGVDRDLRLRRGRAAALAIRSTGRSSSRRRSPRWWSRPACATGSTGTASACCRPSRTEARDDPDAGTEAGLAQARADPRRGRRIRADARSRRVRDRLPADQRHPRRGHGGVRPVLPQRDGHRRRLPGGHLHRRRRHGRTAPAEPTCTP